MKIPSDRKFTQTNEGDIFGVLHESKNMIFDTALGKAFLSRKAVALMSSVLDADFSQPIAINYFSNSYIVLTDDEMFEGSINGDAYTEISGTPAISLKSDSIVFNGYLYVTTDSNLSRWDGVSTWNNSLASLTSGVPHPMAIFDSLTTYKLAIGDGNAVRTYDTSHAANPTVLTLPSQFQITTLRYRNGYLYIGTKNLNGGEARVFIWNGSGANAQYECPIGADWVFSMTEYSTSVAIVTSQGVLLQITGTSYKELAKFPIANYPDMRWGGTGNGRVFNRGMVTIGQSIYINVDGDIDGGFIPEMRSGIWVFHPLVGLTHRAASTTDRTRRDAVASVTDSVLTTSFSHNLKTGDAVIFDGVSGLTGVSQDVVYFATVMSATSFKLSLSRKSLQAGRFVTIGGTPNGSDLLVLGYNTEYGATYQPSSGAIARTVSDEVPIQSLTSEIIWGSRTENQAGDVVYVLNAFNDAWNIGHIATQRIYSENIEQTWNQIYAFIDGLELDNERLIFKAQTKFQEIPPIFLAGVWLNTSTINTTSADQYSLLGDLEEGDEIVIVDGYGQGQTCHIAEDGISVSSGTYSIAVDEEIGTVNGALSFYATNYKKLASRTAENKDNKEYVKSDVSKGKQTAWISLKVEFRGFRMALNVLDLLNAIQKSGKE